LPTIAYFLGIYVRMYFNDHEPQHFHSNGHDWDPIALHDEMKKSGLLGRADAAE